jgi:hypothetical protein
MTRLSAPLPAHLSPSCTSGIVRLFRCAGSEDGGTPCARGEPAWKPAGDLARRELRTTSPSERRGPRRNTGHYLSQGNNRRRCGPPGCCDPARPSRQAHRWRITRCFKGRGTVARGKAISRQSIRPGASFPRSPFIRGVTLFNTDWCAWQSGKCPPFNIEPPAFTPARQGG